MNRHNHGILDYLGNKISNVDKFLKEKRYAGRTLDYIMNSPNLQKGLAIAGASNPYAEKFINAGLHGLSTLKDMNYGKKKNKKTKKHK
jgi:hypothetical protein